MADRIVVTGGAGFIGSNIVAALNARGEDNILIIDHLDRSEKWKNLVGLRYEDYWDKHTFSEAVKQDQLSEIKTLFHMGACSSTTEKDTQYLMDNNYRYSRDLCAWCLQHDVRFIYASSGATYGDGSLGYSDADEETLKLKPLNMYGYSKHLFDLWGLKHQLYRRIVGLKYFNVYGPREDHKGEMKSVAHKAYHQIRQQGEVQLFKSYRSIYKDGEQVRDFIYVKDAVDITLYFYDHSDKAGLFNVGTGQARSWLDLVYAVFSALDQKPRIRFIDMPESLRETYQYHTEADTEKLRKVGYDKEFTSLEDGVRDYVQKHLIVC